MDLNPAVPAAQVVDEKGVEVKEAFLAFLSECVARAGGGRRAEGGRESERQSARRFRRQNFGAISCAAAARCRARCSPAARPRALGEWDCVLQWQCGGAGRRRRSGGGAGMGCAPKNGRYKVSVNGRCSAAAGPRLSWPALAGGDVISSAAYLCLAVAGCSASGGQGCTVRALS